MTHYLTFDHVSKLYRGGNKAVDDIRLTVDKGEFIWEFLLLIGKSSVML